MIEHYLKTVFKSVAFEVTADADGCAQNLPLGTALVMIRPQGSITLKLGASTVAVDLTANVWNGPFHFCPDGETTNSVTVTGSNVETHILCHVDTEICQTMTAPE